MIGWSKRRKKCPEHGLVLRKEDEYSSKANYCPACGQQLTVVSIPYLFQVYFHPAIMIVPAVLVFLFGLFMFLDVRGCAVEQQRHRAIIEKQNEVEAQKIKEQQEQALLTMPPKWKTLYAGMDAIYYRSNKWPAMEKYFKEHPEIQLPRLEPEQLKLFIGILDSSVQDDAFALIVKHMQSGDENDTRRVDFDHP